ncbi:MAG TPA: hypothetical protein VN231_03995, partial [Allosphingosinicella sp.]|nr:hypothetical protein [Allosphingosinicella sp.]
TAAADIDAEASTLLVGEAEAGGDIRLAGEGQVRLDDGSAGGRIELVSLDGPILSDGRLTAAAIEAQAPFDIALNDVAATGEIALSSSGGGISGNSFSSGGDLGLEASGPVALASADAGAALNITAASIELGAAAAAGDIELDSGGDLFLGGADAGGELRAEAAGTAAFGGPVLAQTISVASADIDIAAAGGLGGEGTETVALTVLPGDEPTVLGGGAQGPGYTLSDAEAGRIVAGTLRVEAPNASAAAGSADFLVRDLALDSARIGAFELLTGGTVQVDGALRLANAGSASRIDFSAGERIRLVAPSGSIRILDGSGLPTGTLTLRSNDIWAASQGVLDRLAADPNFAGRDEALLTNENAEAPRGHAEAGDILLFARDTVFVQNSGTADAFAGLTVVEHTLTVTPTGQQPLIVYAFGRRINPDGSFVANEAFFREVQFEQGSAGYTDESQFNLCFINSGLCGRVGGDGPLVPGGPDPITEPLRGRAALAVADEPVDTSFAGEPLIEEPVTSGADSILWDCDQDDDGDCDGEGGDE